MSTLNSKSNSYNTRGVREGVAKTCTTPRSDVWPDIANERQRPGTASQKQGTRTQMATVARSVSPSLSSPSSAFSSLSLSDDDSDYSPDETISPPSYQSIYRPTSPASSVASSPADSFHFGKGVAAAPLLSPPYIEEDPLAAAGAAVSEPSVLSTIFPTSTSSIHSLPATTVKVDDLIGAGWTGSVVNDAAAGLRTLYVSGGKLEDLELREAIMDVIERAEEDWGVTGVVLAVEKETEDLGNLVHGLTYVGFTVLHKPDANPELLLLSLDLM
ncbi:hypothetical protein JCM11641_003834 [Rhodosporidiobolus odoratus]